MGYVHMCKGIGEIERWVKNGEVERNPMNLFYGTTRAPKNTPTHTNQKYAANCRHDMTHFPTPLSLLYPQLFYPE